MSQSNYNRVDGHGYTIGQYDGRQISQHERIIFARNNILSLKWSYIGTIAFMLILSVLTFTSAIWIHDQPRCGSQLAPDGVVLWILAGFTLLVTILPVLWWAYSYFRLEKKLDMAYNSHNINNNGDNMNDIEENKRVAMTSMNIHNNDTTTQTNEKLINSASSFLVLYYIYHFIFNGVGLIVLGFLSAGLIIGSRADLSCDLYYPGILNIVILCIGIVYGALLIVWCLAGLCTRTEPPKDAEKTCRNRLRSNYSISAFGNAWVVSPLVLLFTTILFPVLYFCRK